MFKLVEFKRSIKYVFFLKEVFMLIVVEEGIYI